MSAPDPVAKQPPVKPTEFVTPDRLSELLRRRNLPGFIFLAGHLAATLLTGYLVTLTMGTWWSVPALLVHGAIVVHWFAPFHECSHGTAFRSAAMNRIVGWITGTGLFLIPAYFRYEHLAHHSHTQITGDDPEMIPMAERLGGYFWYATGIPYFYSNLTTLVRMLFGKFNVAERKFLPRRERGNVVLEAWSMVLVYGVLAAVSIWFDSAAVILYWLAPRLVGEPVMRLIRMSEHTGCPRVRHILLNTRTVLTIPLIRWLNWNNAYHAEHHAIPTVPFHALGDLHRVMGRHFEEVRPGYVNTQLHLMSNGIKNSTARDG
ncbi:MAG: fatty acid desaturase [Gemmatimonadetes bacterium]|nr:fatty acid desaturase [Gemmatimonadota bacterium]